MRKMKYIKSLLNGKEEPTLWKCANSSININIKKNRKVKLNNALCHGDSYKLREL
jgi:hypothetical protein